MAAGCSCVRVTRVRGAGGEQVAELLRVSVLGEILEGIRRDKLLPAGPLKNILATNVPPAPPRPATHSRPRPPRRPRAGRRCGGCRSGGPVRLRSGIRRRGSPGRSSSTCAPPTRSPRRAASRCAVHAAR